MSKGHRQGGKTKGRHTTVIPAAEGIVDFLEKNSTVRKIVVGFIKQGIKGGRHAVKIIQMDSGLLLKVRGTASIQEIRVYTKDRHVVQKRLIEYATKKKVQIRVDDNVLHKANGVRNL